MYTCNQPTMKKKIQFFIQLVALAYVLLLMGAMGLLSQEPGISVWAKVFALMTIILCIIVVFYMVHIIANEDVKTNKPTKL